MATVIATAVAVVKNGLNLLAARAAKKSSATVKDGIFRLEVPITELGVTVSASGKSYSLRFPTLKVEGLFDAEVPIFEAHATLKDEKNKALIVNTGNVVALEDALLAFTINAHVPIAAGTEKPAPVVA